MLTSAVRFGNRFTIIPSDTDEQTGRAVEKMEAASEALRDFCSKQEVRAFDFFHGRDSKPFRVVYTGGQAHGAEVHGILSKIFIPVKEAWEKALAEYEQDGDFDKAFKALNEVWNRCLGPIRRYKMTVSPMVYSPYQGQRHRRQKRVSLATPFEVESLRDHMARKLKLIDQKLQDGELPSLNRATLNTMVLNPAKWHIERVRDYPVDRFLDTERVFTPDELMEAIESGHFYAEYYDLQYDPERTVEGPEEPDLVDSDSSAATDEEAEQVQPEPVVAKPTPKRILGTLHLAKPLSERRRIIDKFTDGETEAGLFVTERTLRIYTALREQGGTLEAKAARVQRLLELSMRGDFKAHHRPGGNPPSMMQLVKSLARRIPEGDELLDLAISRMSVKDLRHTLHLTLATIEDPAYYLTQQAEYLGFAERRLEDIGNEVKRLLTSVHDGELKTIKIPEKTHMFYRVMRLATALGDKELERLIVQKLPVDELFDIAQELLDNSSKIKGYRSAIRHLIIRDSEAIARNLTNRTLTHKKHGKGDPLVLLLSRISERTRNRELKFLYTERLTEGQRRWARHQGVKLALIAQGQSHKPFAENDALREPLETLAITLQGNLDQFHAERLGNELSDLNG